MRSVPASEPVIVMGLMGSGKTTIAHLLATALGREMRDSDPDMRARYGLSAAEMLERLGAEVLHDREAEHLRESLAERPATVIAAAASTIEYADLRALLKPAVVILLDAPDDVLAERMLSGKHRPHFEHDLRAMLAKQRARRGPLFREVADLVIDVAGRRPEEIAAYVLDELGWSARA
jgi:shikimate kinase